MFKETSVKNSEPILRDSLQFKHHLDIVNVFHDTEDDFRWLIVTKPYDTSSKDDPLGQRIQYIPFSIIGFLYFLILAPLIDRFQQKVFFRFLRWLTFDLGLFDAPEGYWDGYKEWWSTLSFDPAVHRKRHKNRCPRCIRRRYYRLERYKLQKELEAL